MARVALILPSLAGGGAERVAVNLANGFLSQGHDVDFVVLEKTGALLEQVPDGARVVDLGAPRIRSAIQPLVRYFRTARPDSAQAFMWPITIIAVIARFLSRRRFTLVLSDHTTLSEHYAGRGVAHDAVLKKSIGLLYPKADARIAVSNGAARDVEALGGLDNVEVIRNPIVAPDPLPAPDPMIIAAWHGRRRLLAVGNLVPAKDYPTLLRALAKLPEAGLVIVGDGPCRVEIERLRHELGLADRVVLAGAQANVWPYYASAELFAMSSKHEGWALVLIEALLSGLPIASTDCPHGPRDILAGGDFGTLAKTGDSGDLANAVRIELATPRDPARQAARGREICGADSVALYSKAMGLSYTA